MSSLHVFDDPNETYTRLEEWREAPKPKTWRLYFNRRDDFPFLAAVDNGTITSQIRVQHVQMVNVNSIASRTDMGPSPFPADAALDPWSAKLRDLRRARKGKPNEPTWWMQFEAIAVFGNGGVIFYGG